jgi:thiamine pyrophosphate-dependent acetolactate synthase large subunit-like protein
MKRYTVIKHLLELLHENDILIFSGEEICKEAYVHHKDNHFYVNDSTVSAAIPVALGIAMCTDKRVFVFAGEGEMLRELGVLAQIGASKCRNMFLVLLDNGCYQSAGGYPNIFENVLSKKGLIFNSNMKVSTFTRHFKDKRFKQLKNRFERLMGPSTILMTVDKGIKKNLPCLDIDLIEQRDRISKMIMNLEKETALFFPPILPSIGAETRTLNVDSLQTGGIS